MPEDPRREPVTWRDLVRDIVRPGRGQLVVAVILAVVGFALTLQLRQPAETRYSTLRQSELVAMLDDVTAETRRLEAEIAALEATRVQLESGANASEVARRQAESRLETLQILGGTVPVQGRGIRVTIHDPQGKVTTEIMLNAIEELRDAGAEVIEVDDRIRLVASSWVSRDDTGLSVDGVRVGNPFTIEAIGDPATLAEATRFRGGLVSTIEGERVGGRAQVVEVRDLVIASVVTPSSPQYARPA